MPRRFWSCILPIREKSVLRRSPCRIESCIFAKYWVIPLELGWKTTSIRRVFARNHIESMSLPKLKLVAALKLFIWRVNVDFALGTLEFASKYCWWMTEAIESSWKLVIESCSRHDFYSLQLSCGIALQRLFSTTSKFKQHTPRENCSKCSNLTWKAHGLVRVLGSHDEEK